MWPFTSQRVLGNRWWALAFVVFICWQVADMFGDSAPAGNNATVTDVSGAPVDDDQLRQMAGTLNTLGNAS